MVLCMKHNKRFSGIVRKPLLIEKEALPIPSSTQPKPTLQSPSSQAQGSRQVPENIIRKFFESHPNAIVLFVDDHKNTRLIGWYLLHQLGCSKILLAESAEEALHLYLEHPGEIKLVVSDDRMLQLTGGDLFWQLKQKNNEIRMILCSAGQPPQLEAMVKGGLKGFVPKPYEKEDLGKAIADAIS